MKYLPLPVLLVSLPIQVNDLWKLLRAHGTINETPDADWNLAGALTRGE